MNAIILEIIFCLGGHILKPMGNIQLRRDHGTCLQKAHTGGGQRIVIKGIAF